MKKAAIAVAVLSAVVSGSTLAATVYDAEGTSLKVGGRLEFRGDFNGNDKGEEIEGTMLNKSRVRLNVAGETDIGAGMKGFGFWEAEQGVKSSAGTSTEQETTFKQRYMYVGMKGDLVASPLAAKTPLACKFLTCLISVPLLAIKKLRQCR